VCVCERERECVCVFVCVCVCDRERERKRECVLKRWHSKSKVGARLFRTVGVRTILCFGESE